MTVVRLPVIPVIATSMLKITVTLCIVDGVVVQLSVTVMLLK